MQNYEPGITPVSVAQLSGFPFSTFDELRQAQHSGAASLSPLRGISREYVGSTESNLSAFGRGFHVVFSLCFLWGGAVMVVLAWNALGLAALTLVLVALVSFGINRAWTSPYSTFVAFAVMGWGVVGGQPFFAWAGGTWLLIWFLSNGWQSWCNDRFNDRLRVDEAFFVRNYLSRFVAVDLKGGARYMSEPV